MIEKLPSYFKDPHALAGLGESESILVALSGGADSSLLLHLLCALRQKRNFNLFAAHINHGIRTEEYGNEAMRDESFSREICQELGVTLFVHQVNVPQIAASEGKSLETAARDERYAFFAKIMEQNNIRILATAHNANDNFETQLFNLCRGCGIDGISGIPEVRPLDANGYRVTVRPILRASKQEILEECETCSVRYVTDSTNFEDDCTRNKLRLNVIPLLKEIFPSPEKSGAKLSVSAREDGDFIISEAHRFLESCSDGICVKGLCALHPSVAKRVVTLSFEAKFPSTLERIHIEEVLKFAASGKNGSISLPSGACASFENGKLTFTPSETKKDSQKSYRVPLFEGFNVIEGTAFAVSITRTAPSEETCNEGYVLYSSATVKGDAKTLFAASRREGDTILDGGMHKKLKKLMCDKKIPLSDRDSLPIILSGEEIIYAPLCAVADKARAKKIDFDFNIAIYKMK